MKVLTLREANQQFSKVIRDVEETGEDVIVLRNGTGVAKISRIGHAALTAEQEAARKALIESARSSTGNSEGRRWTRDELYDD